MPVLQVHQGIPQYQALLASPEVSVPVGNARGHGCMGEPEEERGEGRVSCSLRTPQEKAGQLEPEKATHVSYLLP